MKTLYLLMSIFCLRLRGCLLLSCFYCNILKLYLLSEIFDVELTARVKLPGVYWWNLSVNIDGGSGGAGCNCRGVEIGSAAILAELLRWLPLQVGFLERYFSEKILSGLLFIELAVAGLLRLRLQLRLALLPVLLIIGGDDGPTIL